MNAGISRIDPPNTHESVSSEVGAAPNSQSRQDTELTPDRPPVHAAGHAETPPKRSRGFAGMDQRLVRTIARMGGKAAHSAGTAHEFTSEEARVAGRKGGRAPHIARRKRIEEHRDLRLRGGK
jgi:general stress protein YciG